MADEMKKCLIIGSAPETDRKHVRSLAQGRDVICADGGMDTALRFEIMPTLIVGDFDSSAAEPPVGIEIIRLSVHKDDTDMMFCIKEAFRRGYRDFILIGALGGERFDHSVANLLALRYILAHGGKGKILGEGCEVRMVENGREVLNGVLGKTISVFPFGVPGCTVSYSGLEYPLDHQVLRSDEPMGVSNRAVSDIAEITVHQGVALVILEDH